MIRWRDEEYNEMTEWFWCWPTKAKPKPRTAAIRIYWWLSSSISWRSDNPLVPVSANIKEIPRDKPTAIRSCWVSWIRGI